MPRVRVVSTSLATDAIMAAAIASAAQSHSASTPSASPKQTPLIQTNQPTPTHIQQIGATVAEESPLSVTAPASLPIVSPLAELVPVGVSELSPSLSGRVLPPLPAPESIRRASITGTAPAQPAIIQKQHTANRTRPNSPNITSRSKSVHTEGVHIHIPQNNTNQHANNGHTNGHTQGHTGGHPHGHAHGRGSATGGHQHPSSKSPRSHGTTTKTSPHTRFNHGNHVAKPLTLCERLRNMFLSLRFFFLALMISSLVIASVLSWNLTFKAAQDSIALVTEDYSTVIVSQISADIDRRLVAAEHATFLNSAYFTEGILDYTNNRKGVMRMFFLQTKRLVTDTLSSMCITTAKGELNG